jgi:hypothetical protein
MAFSNRQSAENFLATCYSYVPDHANVYQNPGLIGGDEVWNCAENTYYYTNTTSFRLAKDMQNTNDPYLNYWSGGQSGTNLFVAIRDCNLFLENIDKVKDISGTEKARWIAEAKTLKAYYHYFLMQLYGPIPIVRKNIPVTAELEEIKVEREPVDDVVNYIVQLLDEAAASDELPLNIRNQAMEMGRLTKPAALALKAKVLVLAASPIFNGNPDFTDYKNNEGMELINSTFSKKKWEDARNALKTAIDVAHQAGHQLYEFNDNLMQPISDTTFLELTIRNTLTSRFNRELIWGLGDNYSINIQSTSNATLTAFQQGSGAWTLGMHNPTLDVVEQFYTNNGVPIDEDKTFDYGDRYEVAAIPPNHEYYIGNQTIKLHYNREPRFYASIGFDGGKWFNLEAANDKESQVVLNKAGQISGRMYANYCVTGYFSKKLVNYKLIYTRDSNPKDITYPFPIIRLADLYLLYAEALNEAKDMPDSEVYEYIQYVRNKAGLDSGTGGLKETWAQYSSKPGKPTTKEGMREIIRRERFIELALEGQRFWDIRRWRLAMDFFNRPVKGWNISEKDELGYYQVKYIFFKKFTPKNYFWPIKKSDLYSNKNLKQSPQW